MVSGASITLFACPVSCVAGFATTTLHTAADSMFVRGPGYPVLRRIRDVAITAWLLDAAARQDGAAEEFRRSVAALRGDGEETVWQRF
jgi:hypothetical protein